ncbi:hypothetical protein ASG42_24795 [Rhizobium sp. Leaf391]|uniref:hypothetical protein n=1 Tax=Rhizobium sp. Leaf391 TaxID=1736360 RepID=UPI0007142FD0|nr:hypothetical protein [Rhizobium sp. Leaf391]KQT03229.1 hypothetical protein ASG42_24795 [Rhizobium sp. Leaf391]
MQEIKMRNLLLAIGLISSATTAYAQTPEEFIRIGHKSWAAFQCALIAGAAGSLDEDDRTALFKVAMDSGRSFVEARNSGKLPPETVKQWPAALSVEGEPGFVLGNTFGEAMNVIDLHRDDVEWLSSEFEELGCATLR